MGMSAVELHAVTSPGQVEVARTLIAEYLQWVAGIARSHYGITFDIASMVESDLADRAKFYPPTGRFYLVQHAGEYVGVGCLKGIATDIGEVQRMYVQPHVRGVGAGRLLVQRLLEEAKSIGYGKVRLESLKALAAAHALYRSVGFREIDPYSGNSMGDYQAADERDMYRQSAVFMEIDL